MPTRSSRLKVWSSDAPKFRSYLGTTKGNYDKVHRWLRVKFGPANCCENPLCAKTIRFYQWAKLHGKEYEKKRENFIQLCCKCHAEYDKTRGRKSKDRNGICLFKNNEYIGDYENEIELSKELGVPKTTIRAVCEDPLYVKSNYLDSKGYKVCYKSEFEKYFNKEIGKIHSIMTFSDKS